MSSSFRALIGVDGSDDSDEAFRFYVEKMHNPEREAMLVYVVKPLTISSNEMAIYVADIRERNLTEERTKVKQIKETYEEQMRTLGIQGKINIIYYSRKPGKMLCELAKQEKCAVIVVGCRRSGTSSLGPTVDYVLRKASCPVVLASTRQRRESVDSVASLGHFQMMKTPKNSSDRFRRISCPAMYGTPVIQEAVEDEGAVGGAAECKAKSRSEEKVGGGPPSKDHLQVPGRQRRHSTVANVFQQLTLQGSGRRKLIQKTPEPEVKEEFNDAKC